MYVQLHHCRATYLVFRSRKLTFRKLQAEFIDQEEPAFEQIIKCCVFCIFDEKADWENKKFTQAVYTSVVAPLDKLIAKWPTM